MPGLDDPTCDYHECDTGPSSSADRSSDSPIVAALRVRPFRRVFAGQMASNIGTWMQNVTLIALANSMTKSAIFVGIVSFAQLGPMFFLSPIGGVIADRFDRRKTLMIGSSAQGILSAVLAALAWNGHPGRAALVVVVAGIGIAGALTGPSMGAMLPALVGYDHLAGAVALNSANMNGSRVLGPLLAVAANGLGSPGWAFLINAGTYGFVIVAIATTRFDARPAASAGGSAWSRLVGGFRAARANPVASRVLFLIAMLSLFSLVFIYQMPNIASDLFGLDGSEFYRLFASFGFGAAVAALSVGTFLTGSKVLNAARPALVAFAAFLALFTLAPNVPVAYLSVSALGFAYFTVVTCLSTTLQEHIDESQRGRIMGLWMLAWAGLVPIGSLLAGPVIEATSATTVLLFGAAVALALAPFGTLAPLVEQRCAELDLAGRPAAA